MGLTQSIAQWVTWGCVPGLKLPGRETDRSRVYSVSVKNVRAESSSHSYVIMAWYVPNDVQGRRRTVGYHSLYFDTGAENFRLYATVKRL